MATTKKEEKAIEKIEEKEEKLEERGAYDFTTEEIKALNIFQKMDLARVFIGSVDKSLLVNQSYKATSESDVLRAVNEAERKARLISYTSQMEIIEKGTIQAKNGINMWVRVRVVVTLVNIDSPSEKLEFFGYGDGIDYNDKALGKAATYANKYALMKGYKIPTGEDPDYFASEQTPIAVKYATEEEVKEWESIIGADNVKKACEAYKVKSLTEVPEEEILKRIEKSRKMKKEREEREALLKNE